MKDSYCAPELLAQHHNIEHFDCGEASLNEWLNKKALKNQMSGASRTFVTVHQGNVAGYYCLSAGCIAHENVSKKLRRNMPDPLPVLMLGRLAIDKQYHNKGLGSALLRDAMLRVINVSEDAGIFAVLVHALSAEAKQFYISRGFVESPFQSMTLMMTTKTIRDVLTEV